jgi:pSer/pThr/pTyr-binding forkhead associated (FHA) protein
MLINHFRLRFLSCINSEEFEESPPIPQNKFSMAILRFASNLQREDPVDLRLDKMIFGRHLSCQCVLNNQTVSREHFFIERAGDKYFVVDSGSGNGTYVNGERVTWVELKEGDVIKAGPFFLRFEESLEDQKTLITQRDVEVETAFDEELKRIYPGEYLEGIRHFNAGRYFEAHEIWEDIWMRSSDEKRLFYQMLIQAAVALHHYEKDNRVGARGLYARVVEKIDRLPKIFMSLEVDDFARQFKTFFLENLENPDDISTAKVEVPRPTMHLLASEGVSVDL